MIRKGIAMFNMESIGRKISELRKAKNMTQMELADKMSISFQAVSNWERGNSMPDIAKLPELAQIFEVTIDELLGERNELLESVASGQITEYLDQNEVTVDKLSGVAPVLKPNQVNTIFARTEWHSLHEIVDLLPFISNDLIDKLARKVTEQGDYSAINELAPFLSGTTIDEIAKKMMCEGKDISEVLPFVSAGAVAELAETSYQKRGLSSLEDLFPFMSQEALRKIAEREYKINGLYNLEAIAPFLDRSCLSELAKKAIEKDGIKAISTILPFLDRSFLSEYIEDKYM